MSPAERACLLQVLRQREQADGLASRSLCGVTTRWCVESSDTGLDMRNAVELDDETGFQLLELDEAVAHLQGDEILAVHRHVDYDFVAAFTLDLSEIDRSP